MTLSGELLIWCVLAAGSIFSTGFLTWFYERQKKRQDVMSLVAQLVIVYVAVNGMILAFLYLVLYSHVTPL